MVSDKPIYFLIKKIRWNIIRRSKYLIHSIISYKLHFYKKKIFKKIIDKIMIFKFPNTWMDFRLVCQAAIDFDDIKVLDKYLTYYRQNPNSQIIEFKKNIHLTGGKREKLISFKSFYILEIVKDLIILLIDF